MYQAPTSPDPTNPETEDEEVYFSYAKCIENLYNLGVTILVILIMTYMFLVKENNKDLLYPCKSSKITYGKLNELRAEINLTAKEIETIATVLNYDLNANKHLIKKYENLTDYKNFMEEKWISHKIDFYECYKNNVLEVYYRTPGYYIIGYYILISIIFMAIFALLQIAQSKDLPEEEVQSIKILYFPTQILWYLHLFACPLFVWTLFYSNDISDSLKREFPIYPHYEQMVEVN